LWQYFRDKKDKVFDKSHQRSKKSRRATNDGKERQKKNGGGTF
jgi:hypothetical protein